MDDEADLKKIVNVLRDTLNESPNDFQIHELIDFNESEEDDENEENEILLPNLDFDFNKPFTFDISTIYKYNQIYSLKPDEKVLIDSCKELDLKRILILNRNKNMQLIQLYKKYKDLLIECKQNIVDKNEIVKQYYEAHKAQSQSSGSWRVGAPYFKDKDFYLAPLNEDAARKKKNNELCYYDLMPLKKWTGYECDRLLKSVKFNYNSNQIAEINKSLRLSGSSNSDNKREKNQMLELKLEQLNNYDSLEVPCLGSDENINWIRVAEVFVKDKHSDFECRSLWNMHVHPDINKSKWKASETNNLLTLVKKYNTENWDQIAKELGTKRSCFGVCTYYFQNYHNPFKKGEFTYGEDKKLLELVNKYKMGTFIPWVKIVRHFKNRTRSQLYHRFTYYLNQVDKKRGKFTDAEDVIIMLCVKLFGRDFKKCSEFLPDRSTSQIKARYYTGLEVMVKKGTWTVDEDKFMIDFVNEKGQQWTILSKEMSRSAGQIRQRFHLLKSHLDQGISLADCPRRKHQIKEDPYNFSFLRNIVDRLAEGEIIPTLKEVETTLAQLKALSTNTMDENNVDQVSEENEYKVFENIDNMLTEFFCQNSDPDPTKTTPSILKKTIDDVEILLDVLNVDLDIPENIDHISNLDSLDKEILTELSKKKIRNNVNKSSKIKRLLPPNFYTTNGIREILIKNIKYKGRSNYKIFNNLEIPSSIKNSVKSEVNKELAALTGIAKKQIEVEKKLFLERFVSMFKWPAILTLEEPSKDIMSISNNFAEEEVRPKVKRTFSRVRKKVEPAKSDQSAKIRIVEGSAKNSLKLIRVTDKSVIENLMKDNSKKLFCLNNIKCGDKTKTMIKEVDLNFLPGRSDITNVQSTSKSLVNVKPEAHELNSRLGIHLKMDISEDEEEVDEIEISDTVLMDTSCPLNSADSDMVDLEKLTNFIKSEKHRE